MKRIFFHAVLVILFFCNSLMAQSYRSPPQPPQYPYVSQPGATLAQITDSLAAHANPNDTEEGGEQDQIKTFTTFWKNRVSANNGSGPNMFQKYLMDMRTTMLAG